MSLIVAVLDSCVLLPAALRDTLLRAAEANLYRPQWSSETLDEVERNLSRTFGLTVAQASGLIAILQATFADATVTHHGPLIASMMNHPKDRHVLAAAVASGAQIIVTYNRKDFPDLAVQPYHIEVQSPDEFLTHLYSLDPERMTAVIIEQAHDLRRPPMMPVEVLEILTIHAPTFAALVRAQLPPTTPAP